jgi:hypothetical protein
LDKVTWNKILQDFKERYPHFRKEVSYWRPHSYATIEVWLKDNRKLTYNYDEHVARFIDGPRE